MRLQRRNLILRDFAGLGIHLAKDLLPKTGVPSVSLGIHNHVVRLPAPLRQIVFRIDNLRCSALRPRKGSEGVSPLRSRTQIDSAQILTLAAPGGLPLLERVFAAADTRREQFL